MSRPGVACAFPPARAGGYTAGMNRRTAFVSAALAIALPLVLSACGNKGPLVLPDQAPAETTVPAEAASTPPAPAQTPPAEPPAPPVR